MISDQASAIVAIAEAMSDRRFYDPPASRVDCIQTHVSFVFLTDRLGYKLKKAVRFSFLDFSTPESRREACLAEIELNRPLATGVYRRLVGICRRGEHYAFCDAGDPDVIEVAIEMERLPADGMLATKLERGDVTLADLDRLLDVLIPFYRNAEAGPAVSASASPDKLRRLMAADFAETRRFHGDTILASDDERIQTYCYDELGRYSEILSQRAREGKARDGHGDLHAGNICFREGHPVVFDRIEFEPEFRRRDVAGDVAFLSMDLELHGRGDLARYFVERFAARTNDSDLAALVPMFACHRAYIRGKVESLKANEEEVPPAEQERARQSARAHFDLAYRLTWSSKRILILVMGLSGTGKSTLAAELARRMGALHVNSDRVRKELAGLAPTDRSGVNDETHLYSPEFSRRTYEEMYSRALLHFDAEERVVVDATALRVADREAARAIARRGNASFVIVECVASDSLVRERLAARKARGDDPSDADAVVYDRQRERFERVTEGEGDWVLRVDSACLLRERIERVEAGCRSLRGNPPRPVPSTPPGFSS